MDKKFEKQGIVEKRDVPLYMIVNRYSTDKPKLTKTQGNKLEINKKKKKSIEVNIDTNKDN